MNIIITINADNAAFEGDNAGSELARILYRFGNDSRLRTLAELNGRKLLDTYGNTVGSVKVSA